MTIEFWWRQIFEILMIHKPSLWSRDVPQKIWARSVQPFWRLLETNKQTNKQTPKQTDKPNLYIDKLKGPALPVKKNIGKNKYWKKILNFFSPYHPPATHKCPQKISAKSVQPLVRLYATYIYIYECLVLLYR